jgi:DNA ligase-1
MAWGGSRKKIMNENEIINFYINNRMPIENIAEHFKISRTKCYEILSCIPEYRPFRPRQFKKESDISMKQVLDIIQEISNTSSRNDKEAILSKYKDNAQLKDILYFVFNPYIVTGLAEKKLSKFKNPKVIKADKHFSDIFEVMEYLQVHNTGSDDVVKSVLQFINNSDEEYRDFYKQIVTKSLKIGMQPKSINKVLGKGFIPEFNCLLAESYFDEADKLNSEFIITEKLDGSRMLIIKENGAIKCFSRQGQPILGLIEIENEVKQLPDNSVFDGEILLNLDLPSAELFRATQKESRKDGEKRNLIFNLFDFLPLSEFKEGKSKKDCLTRKTELHEMLQQLDLKWIKEVPMLYVGSDKEKVLEYLNKAISEEKEGVMVSIAKGLYQTKRTKDLLKVKKFHTLDLIIRDVIEGQSKYTGKMGAVVVQYKGNEVQVGSGWSDQERIEVFNNKDKYIGKVIEISYFEETNNEKTGLVSLRFPTFCRFRFDKIEESYV